MSDRWFFKQRQEWIAQMARIYGFVNRRHLIAKFEISEPQASTDLQYFQSHSPDVLVYNKTTKRYEDADRLARAQDVRDAYSELVESLQNLCSEFGCLGGEHRINWLRVRLERLRELEAPATPSPIATAEPKKSAEPAFTSTNSAIPKVSG